MIILDANLVSFEKNESTNEKELNNLRNKVMKIQQY